MLYVAGAGLRSSNGFAEPGIDISVDGIGKELGRDPAC